jgi:hypothetical protein
MVSTKIDLINWLRKDSRLQWLRQDLAPVKQSVLLLLIFEFSFFSAQAGETVTCQSPEGKFALRHVYADMNPSVGDTAIIETATHKTVLPLTSNRVLGELKVVWSDDSQRVAYFEDDQNVARRSTRVFLRSGSSFNEIQLPELPASKLPENATGSDADTNTRVEPIKWIGSADLLLEKELLNPTWRRAALKITLGFDEDDRPLVRKTEQEKTSVVDYFVLLPADYFELGPAIWLRRMQTDARVAPLRHRTWRQRYRRKERLHAMRRRWRPAGIRGRIVSASRRTTAAGPLL